MGLDKLWLRRRMVMGNAHPVHFPDLENESQASNSSRRSAKIQGNPMGTLALATTMQGTC